VKCLGLSKGCKKTIRLVLSCNVQSQTQHLPQTLHHKDMIQDTMDWLLLEVVDSADQSTCMKFYNPEREPLGPIEYYLTLNCPIDLQDCNKPIGI